MKLNTKDFRNDHAVNTFILNSEDVNNMITFLINAIY